MPQKILITAALPYANGPIHFGHLAGCYLPADIYARFCRLKKQDSLFICGSDEYGVAISMSAEAAGRTPKQHVDNFHQVNKSLFDKVGIQFDHYSRTTWPGHIEATYQYFKDLCKNGYIEERETEQLYSEKESRFLADRYVVGTCPKCGYENARGDECTKCGSSFEATDLKNPRSKLTQSPLVLKKTTHWFIRLDLFKEKLIAWLDAKDWKPNVKNFIKGYIQDLRPRAITRDMSWGIPVPLDKAKGKVLYVWFEAPIGYISATKEWNDKRWKDYWYDPKTRLVQFIGKDNIPFHAAIFPAMTMGQNEPYKIVDDLPANEFYNLEGRQFSKSDGWYIDLADFLDRYTADQLRYTIAANAPETSDSEFTWKDFQTRSNADLLGKFGNFIHRTLVFIQNNCEAKLPTCGTLDARDEQFVKELNALVDKVEEAYAGFHVRLAAQTVMEIAALGNVYFDAKRPWQLAKDESTRSQMNTVLSLCVECVKMLALASCPIIPDTAEKIWNFLGQKEIASQSWDEVKKMKLPANLPLLMPRTLFTRLEDEQIQKEIDMLNQSAATPTQAGPQEEAPKLVTFDEVRKLDLRIAKILHAERVPKSKKLLKLQVDTGSGTRTVVAGIGHKFEPEALIGKQVVMVANLQPATLMGVESQGMLLVASHEEKMQLLECQELPPGSIVS